VPRGTLTLKLVDRDGNVHLRRLSRARSTERSAFYDFQTPLKPIRRLSSPLSAAKTKT